MNRDYYYYYSFIIIIIIIIIFKLKNVSASLLIRVLFCKVSPDALS